ncbi:family 10 glycosylhydrolase [Dysgonomonas sp. Marseille-P4677]|uniref:family 10 glycosylhydrolase n=1 Tax=Dysgonomonas sp. Marseille-P4677 TaxID=2364790 RepID=UPI0019119458|nr:family 10 glycosylhydrolase [Dysgonomonas sp. Marseille-P4677]MBK5720070.1 family 10 glycosylhydrolase [Dysgonomonas sp. Marseille-P4677]
MKKLLNTYRLLALVFAFTIISCNSTNKESESDNKYKHWVWINPQNSDTEEELTIRYKKYHDAGIAGIFFEADSEKHFRTAKAQGLEAHRWMWIMNRGDALKEHPEWAAVSRKGESCADHPPYVDYYRWMCPSRPEVAEFLVNDVKNTLAKDYVDGIHMDYVRFSDVVLAVNLWKVYDIVQTEELPEYDFCYCGACKAGFKEKYHQNIDSIQYPTQSLSWRSYRYNAVTNIVNQISEVAKANHKPLTAAVFPTPDVAKRLVMQDWTNWPLDAVYPMIYHGFYKEDVPWIGDAVKQGLRGIDGRFPLYAGLYMPDFKNNQEIEEGIKYALQNGASGVSIFGDLNDDILAILSKYRTKPE